MFAFFFPWLGSATFHSADRNLLVATKVSYLLVAAESNLLVAADRNLLVCAEINLLVATEIESNLLLAAGSESNLLLAAESESNLLLAAESESNLLLAAESESNLLLAAESESNLLLAAESESNLLLAAERESNLLLAAESESNLLLTAEKPEYCQNCHVNVMRTKKTELSVCDGHAPALALGSFTRHMIGHPGWGENCQRCLSNGFLALNAKPATPLDLHPVLKWRNRGLWLLWHVSSLLFRQVSILSPSRKWTNSI